MARMEIVTGRERRRRWSEEDKLEILQEAATSGLSVADVARRHDVVPQQIYIWRRQLLAKAKADAGVHGASPRFLPVAVIGETEAPETPQQSERTADKPRGTARQARIEIRCKGGRVLKVEAGIDPAVLQALIRSVESA
jgi:transposase